MDSLNLKKVTMASALALVGSFPVVEEADGAIFVKIPGIKGDVTTKGHEGEMDVLSWSWSSARDDEKRNSDDICMRALNLARAADLSTPALLNAHSDGRVFEHAVVTVTGADDKDEFVYEFRDVRLSAYSTGGRAEFPAVNESILLEYSELTGFRLVYNTDGTVQRDEFFVGPNDCY